MKVIISFPEKAHKINKRWASKRVDNIKGMIERMGKDDIFFFKTAGNMLMDYSQIPHTTGDDALAHMLGYMANRLSTIAMNLNEEARLKKKRKKR